jgi:hypothetical protein
MKKSELKQIIREELMKELEVNPTQEPQDKELATISSLKKHLFDLAKELPQMNKEFNPQEVQAFDKIVKLVVKTAIEPGVNTAPRLNQFYSVLQKTLEKNR